MMYKILNLALLTVIVVLLFKIRAQLRFDSKLNIRMAARYTKMTMTDDELRDFAKKLFSEKEI